MSYSWWKLRYRVNQALKRPYESAVRGKLLTRLAWRRRLRSPSFTTRTETVSDLIEHGTWLSLETDDLLSVVMTAMSLPPGPGLQGVDFVPLTCAVSKLLLALERHLGPEAWQAASRHLAAFPRHVQSAISMCPSSASVVLFDILDKLDVRESHAVRAFLLRHKDSSISKVAASTFAHRASAAEDKVWIAIAQRDYERAVEYGKESLPTLLEAYSAFEYVLYFEGTATLEKATAEAILPTTFRLFWRHFVDCHKVCMAGADRTRQPWDAEKELMKKLEWLLSAALRREELLHVIPDKYLLEVAELADLRYQIELDKSSDSEPSASFYDHAAYSPGTSNGGTYTASFAQSFEYNRKQAQAELDRRRKARDRVMTEGIV